MFVTIFVFFSSIQKPLPPNILINYFGCITKGDYIFIVKNLAFLPFCPDQTILGKFSKLNSLLPIAHYRFWGKIGQKIKLLFNDVYIISFWYTSEIINQNVWGQRFSNRIEKNKICNKHVYVNIVRVPCHFFAPAIFLFLPYRYNFAPLAHPYLVIIINI